MKKPRAKIFWAPVLSAGVFTAGGIFAEESPDAQRLLSQLQNDDFDLRRQAAEKLAQLGESARQALEQAAKSEDPEIQQMANRLLNKLSRAIIQIRAWDRDGKPAAGAEAEAKIYAFIGGVQNWNEPIGENITLKPDGTMELSPQAPGQINLQLGWKKWGMVRDSGAYWSLLLQRGQNVAAFVLSRGGGATATLTDGEGKPLKDGQLVLYPRASFEPALLDLQMTCSDNWDRNGQTASCDNDGKAKIENIQDGVYQVVYKCSGYESQLGPRIRIRENSTIDLPAVRLPKLSMGKVQFRLVKADGSPLKKTKLSASLDYVFEGPRSAELVRLSRKLKAQLNMQRQQEQLETDDDGKITMEDIRPGKYRLSASAAEICWAQSDIQVKPGETVDLKELKPAKGGTISGKIKGTDGKGIAFGAVFAVLESEITDANEGDLLTDWRFIYRQMNVPGAAQTKQDGTYELKNLPPGKYAISIAARNNQMAVIYGVVVETDKTVTAPDLVLPGAAAQNTNQVIKGVVLLPDGQPAANAGISLYSPGRWARNCDEKGGFEFHVNTEMGRAPAKIVVKAPRCKTKTIEISADAKKDDLKIQLEKQEFGDLLVKVTDQNGQPLSNVSVKSTTSKNVQRYNRYGVSTGKRNVTNARGEVSITGLAVGERIVQLERDGYYCPGEIKTNVIPGKESELLVRLLQGQTLKGEVQMPAGVDVTNVVVFLSSGKVQTTSVDPAGRFEFQGLVPGTYTVTVAAPGYICAEKQKLTLKSDNMSAALQTISLKLIKPTAAAVQLGKEFSGWSATLTPEGANSNPAKSGITLNDTVDSSGRLEYWGLAPGKFDISLTPPPDVTERYRWYEMTIKRATAAVLAGPVESKPIENFSALGKAEAQELKCESAKGSARGQIICEPTLPMMNANYGNLNLKLVGTNAVATIFYSYPYEFSRLEARTPIIIGTPPEAKEKRPAPPGSFLFQGLPPGEYKLYADLVPYRYSAVPLPQEAESKSRTPIATFTLKKDEQADLGTVKFVLKPEDLSAINGIDEMQMEYEVEDLTPVFQP